VYCTILELETRVGASIRVLSRSKYTMSTNPLFPDNPLRPEPADDAAVQLIRAKVSRAYGSEPAAETELKAAKQDQNPSRHQQFMLSLAQSGKDLAAVQTEWHAYYAALPDSEKRAVWEEFYSANQYTPYQKMFQKQQPVATRQSLANAPSGTPMTSTSGVTVSDHSLEFAANPDEPRRTRPKHKKGVRRAKVSALARKSAVTRRALDSESAEKVRVIKKRIHQKVSAGGKLQAKDHVQSLLFGFGIGGMVLLILLFSFFNEFIIAPFIQPSRNDTNIPMIASNITAEQAASPTIIVPKIGIQIPIDFALTSNSEDIIQNSLENGVVHYPSTVFPGQNGNGAYFGHSAQNILNNGKAKFAFVRLRDLATGDVFSILYQGKVYSYEVFAREVVPPTQVSVLNDTKGKQATVVLVTCDPPGFSTNRLVVWGEQISPSPALNGNAAPTVATHPTEISSNGPTLWTRLWRNIQFWR
jgi:LPXTG-site transpeptidase (sortase) family protein